MSGWLFVHLIFLGLWGGCVAVEMVMEFSGLKPPEQRHHVAQLHYRIDVFVEIPILIMVLLSGIMLFDAEKLSLPLYNLKIAMGLLPVVINALCVIPVILRKKASDHHNEKAMQRHTRWIFAAFFTGFAGAMAALAIGLRLLNLI